MFRKAIGCDSTNLITNLFLKLSSPIACPISCEKQGNIPPCSPALSFRNSNAEEACLLTPFIASSALLKAEGFFIHFPSVMQVAPVLMRLR